MGSNPTESTKTRQKNHGEAVEQVARCSQNGDSAVRTALAERQDFFLTQEQMDRCLKDTNEEVRYVFEDRRMEWETKAFKDKHSAVVKKPAKRTAL